MNRVRFTVAALGLALLCMGSAVRADDEKPQRPGTTRQRQGQDRQRPGLREAAFRLTPLLTKDEAEKLKLTDDQKPKVEKIVSAFNKKQSEGMDKLREAMQKARDSGDQDAFREVMQKARAMMQDTEKARDSAEAKLKEVLTEGQKKTFDDLKKDRPARPGFGGRGPGGQGFPGGRGGFGGGFAPGQILPSAVQERLELSKEQKARLEKLQKEVDEKLQKILNDEQKKKLDELKSGRRGGGRGGEGAGRPGRPERPRRPGTPRSDLD
ncbi:MAG: Spy/CpxP family protein refolding chaperone [Planctomycetes bacterium]|nr:Spy/CpxP family protein refolding chaperone [Planctomycetota bacterium]